MASHIFPVLVPSKPVYDLPAPGTASLLNAHIGNEEAVDDILRGNHEPKLLYAPARADRCQI